MEITKHDIKDLDEKNPTDTIYNLQPKTYLYNTDPSAGEQIGYIAEDVATLNKHFATYNEPDGVPIAINYNSILVFLVEEVKKLKTKQQELLSRIEFLEQK